MYNSPTTIPQIKRQIPHELNMAMLNINSRAEPSHILRNIVAKDNRSHRRLSRPALPHQQHLPLLLPPIHDVALRRVATIDPRPRYPSYSKVLLLLHRDQIVSELSIPYFSAWRTQLTLVNCEKGRYHRRPSFEDKKVGRFFVLKRKLLADDVEKHIRINR